MDHSPPGSSVHGILQARVLEWVAVPSPRGSPNPETELASLRSTALAGGFFTTSATWEAPADQNARVYFILKGFTLKDTPTWYQIYTQYTSVSCIPVTRKHVRFECSGPLNYECFLQRLSASSDFLVRVYRYNMWGILCKGWLRNRSIITEGCSVYHEIFKQVGECSIPRTRSSVPGYTHTHTRAILYVTRPAVNSSVGSLCHDPEPSTDIDVWSTCLPLKELG